MITPTSSFKDNLALLPTLGDIACIELRDADGAVLSSIENQPGKQGSLVVYQYLKQTFGALTPDAASHALDIFAEHTEDAKNRPGAHSNIDRLFEVISSGTTQSIAIIPAD